MAKSMYCTQCGHVGPSRRVMPGSILVELAAWLLFLLPGILYSLWRHSASYRGCRECKSSALIPVDSPRARQALQPLATENAPRESWDMPLLH